MADRASARRVAEPPPIDEHAGHHRHLEGTGVICSCGELVGVDCVMITEDVDQA